MPNSLLWALIQEIAVFALSCITSPKEPVKIILPSPGIIATSIGSKVPPTEVHARPFTRPTSFFFSILSRVYFLIPKYSDRFLSEMLKFSDSLSIYLTATFLKTFAIVLSSVLTPASLV